MRAILIEEERFSEIRETLKYEAERLAHEKPEWSAAIAETHRLLNYHFVRWAQSHGASCTR
jgi:hypothetical protein